MYSSAKSSTINSGVTASGATLSAGIIDSKARFKPATEIRKVCEWLRRHAIASITTTTVRLEISSGASAIKCWIVNSIALLPGRSELSEGGAEPLLHAMHRCGRGIQERLRVHADEHQQYRKAEHHDQFATIHAVQHGVGLGRTEVRTVDHDQRVDRTEHQA